MLLAIYQTGVAPATSLLIVLASLVAIGAAIVYVFLRRRQSRRRLEQRVAELEALSQAGRALVAAEMNIDALCELIAESAGQIIDNHTFQVGLFEDSFYEIRYWTVNGQRQPTPRCFDLDQDDAGQAGQSTGLVGWIRDHRQPLLVGDFAREMGRLPARPSYQNEAPPRSALFIPLISGDRAIGVVAAQSDQPQRFGQQDLRRLTILANQAAAAIANARLFAQERMRAAHLELVGQIARQVNAVEDLDEIFDQVVCLTQETFGFHPVNIFTVEPMTAEVVIQASSIDEIGGSAPRRAAVADPIPAHLIRLSMGQGVVGAAARNRQTIVVNNAEEDARFIARLDPLPAELSAGTRAEIAIPLVVNQELLGVLDVQSPDIGVFGATEKMVLEALAAEVASAIYKARQLEREQEQAWVTTAQLQVAEAISRSRDLDEILDSVARLTPMLVGVGLTGIMLWNREAERYEGAALVDSAGDLDDSFVDRSLAIGDWSALDAVHVGQQALTTAQVPEWLARAGGRGRVNCLQLYPLTSSQGAGLGVMLVAALHESQCSAGRPIIDPFDPAILRRREELLASIARQTAQGLESAYLRAAQQEEAWVNTALLQVAEAVNSLTDLNDILDSIVRLVPLLVGVDSVFILVWNETRGIFQAGPSYGVSTMGRGLVETLEIDQQEFLSLSPQMAADFDSPGPRTTHYSLRVPAWLESVMNTSTAYNFPLVARGRVVGAMIVGLQGSRTSGLPLTLRRANILNGIAQQAATAVVNNQLYRESADRVRMQQELDVAHKIQASFLPDASPRIEGCSVASHWQAARQVSGDFYDFLQLDEDRWGIVIADVADKGVPAALFMALTRTILRTVALNRDDPAQVLMRANEIIGREAKSDLFVTLFYGIWDNGQQRFSYANAGHNKPLVLQSNGAFRELQGNGLALGVIPEILLKSYSVPLKEGEAVILYTDGVTEALNEDFDEFGMQRLQIAAKAASRQNAHAIVRSITDAIGDHAGETPQFDDITLVVLKRHGQTA